MPRTDSLPKYRKHKASKQAVVTLNGRDHYLGPHGSRSSVKEYDRLVAEWLARGRRSIEVAEVTVSELLLAYAQFAKVHYRKHGQATGSWDNQKPTIKLFRDMYGDTLVSEFGPLKLKAFREKISRPREMKFGHRVEVRTASRRYINDQVSLVRRIFRWGLAEELVPAGIVTAISAVDGIQAGRTDLPEGKRVEPVSEKHVEAVLPLLTPTVRAMVQVQLLSGMRPNEVLQLRPMDVDRSGEVWTYKPQSHKTEHHGRQRIVPLGPQAQEALMPFLDRKPDMSCFVPAESFSESLAKRKARRVTPLSCGNRPGTNRKSYTPNKPSESTYTNDSYRRAIHRACDAAKIPRWSPNQLRHSAATKIRSQFGLEQARVVLGHSKTMTTEIYAEKDLESAKQVARALG
jgi:integrase